MSRKNTQFALLRFAAAACLLSLVSGGVFGSYQEFYFSDQIDIVLIDENPDKLTGFGVGTTVNGTFRYGTSDADAVVSVFGDNETDYFFEGLPYGATLDSTTFATGIPGVTVVSSDNTFMTGDLNSVAALSSLLNIEINLGDEFDAWTVRTDEEPVDDVSLGVTFFGFTEAGDLGDGVMGDQTYRPAPPASIGIDGFDGAIFGVSEIDAEGNTTFFGLGRLDSFSVMTVHPVPLPATAWLLASALGVFGYLGKRKAHA